MKKLFQIPCHVKGLKTCVDGGNQIIILTQELPPEDMTLLFSLKNKPGWMLFKETEIKPEDLANIPDITLEFKNEKSPSQRLRNVIFRIWEQTDRKQPFEVFYRVKLETIIEWLKEKYLQ